MACDCDHPQQKNSLQSFESALEKMLSAVSPLTDTEKVPLSAALDRVLAAPMLAPVNVPPHNNSAMDGYAIHSRDIGRQAPFKKVGTILAGQFYEGELNPGECLRIMTGAPLPACADTVVMQENTQVDGDLVRLVQEPRQGANVRQAGEDIREGNSILEKGQLVSPSDMGLLASLGISEVEVIRKPRIALLSTGDELVEPGERLSKGQIYESNRFALMGMLSRLNVDIIDLGIIADDPADIEAALIRADKAADIVISSGGVSVGDADFVKPLLSKLGEINFWKLAIKPGKPFAFGQLPNSYFMGLPGNPVSALVTFNQLVVPFIHRLVQASGQLRQSLSAVADEPFLKRPGRLEFQRAISYADASGALRVRSVGAQGSGILSSVSKANCFVILPADSGGFEAGDVVSLQRFDASLSRFF